MKTIYLFISIVSCLYPLQMAYSQPILIDSVQISTLPKINNTEDKVFGLSKIWSEIKYNFVNIDKVNFDIDSLYQSTLTRILLTRNDIEYYDELELFLAKFNDGHTGIVDRSYKKSDYINDISGTIREIEGKYYFTVLKKNAGIDSMLLSAELIEIKGLPVSKYIERYCLPKACASTEHERRRIALARLHEGPIGHFLEGKAKTGKGDILNFKLQYNWETLSTAEDDYWSVPWGIYPPKKRISVQWCQNIARLTIKDFREDMIAMLDSVMFDLSNRNPEGLILDLRYNRGGVTDVAWRLQMHIDPSDTIRSFGYETRINDGYARSQGNYREEYELFYLGKAYKKQNPEIIVRDIHINAVECPIVCLIGSLSSSACEDFLVNIYDLPDRPIFIGEETEGSSGAPLLVDLPDGGVVRICTLRELFPYSNKLFVNKGIVPDIVIHRTLSSERQNKDLALEKAIEILKKVHNDSLHIEHN